MYAEKHLEHPHSKIIYQLQFINNKNVILKLVSGQENLTWTKHSRDPSFVQEVVILGWYHSPRYHQNITATETEKGELYLQIQSLKTNYFYRCIAKIFPNATDVQQNREYQPFQKILKIDIEKFTNIWKLTVCPFS